MSDIGEPLALALFGFACSLVGLLAGHRLQLGMKRREERAAASKQLRIGLRNVLTDLDPKDGEIDFDSLHVMLRTAGFWHRRRLQRLIDEYQEAHGDRRSGKYPYLGEVYSDPARVRRAALALLKACDHP